MITVHYNILCNYCLKSIAEVEAYGDPEAVEAISEVVPVSIAETERMIRDDEIEDGFALTAYLLAKVKGFL